MRSISGPEAFALIKELKLKYGVKQKSIADALGISRQAVTDMKAERRRFTKMMGEKLIIAFANEPWINWLRSRLDALFTSPPTSFAVPEGQAPANYEESTTDVAAPSARVSSRETRQIGFPVLISPCKGDPRSSPANTQKCSFIPDELFIQTSSLANSYILVVDFDSRNGRLRRGDWVLVLQDPERDCETMIVEYRGALRLARRGKYERDLNRNTEEHFGEMDWVLLDSGMVVPEGDVEAAGCIVGIVMAQL